MNIKITVKKLPKKVSEEDCYEALAVGENGIVLGALGDSTAKALWELQKKFKDWRRFLHIAMPFLETKLNIHNCSFKVSSEK